MPSLLPKPTMSLRNARTPGSQTDLPFSLPAAIITPLFCAQSHTAAKQRSEQLTCKNLFRRLSPNMQWGKPNQNSRYGKNEQIQFDVSVQREPEHKRGQVNVFLSPLVWMWRCPTTDRGFLNPHPHIQPGIPLPRQQENLSCFAPCSLARVSAWAGEQTMIWQHSVCAGDFLTISPHAAALGYGAYASVIHAVLSPGDLPLCFSLHCFSGFEMKWTAIWVKGKLQDTVMPLEMLLLLIF